MPQSNPLLMKRQTDVYLRNWQHQLKQLPNVYLAADLEFLLLQSPHMFGIRTEWPPCERTLVASSTSLLHCLYAV
jgi:hypothetical protein